jgi:drug/metabolite transporter (DMT)-like permease
VSHPRVRKGQHLALATAFRYALQNLAMRAAGVTVDSFVVALYAGLPTVLTSVVLTLADPSRRARLAALWREGPSGRRPLGGLALAGLLGYAVGNPLFVKSLALGGAVIGTPAATPWSSGRLSWPSSSWARDWATPPWPG